MPSRIQIAIFLGALAAMWTPVLILHGVSTPALITSFLGLVTPTGLLLIAFDKWMWRWRWLYPWLVSQPNIEGTWRGEFISSFREQDGTQIPPARAFLVVRQSFFSVSVRMLTLEARSDPLAHTIKDFEEGGPTLIGTYRGIPNVEVRSGSALHFGGVMLRILGGNPATRLEGEYWTSRGTHGGLAFKERLPKAHEDFETATRDSWPEPSHP